MQTTELNSSWHLNLVRKSYGNLRACFLHVDIMYYSMVPSNTHHPSFSQLLRTKLKCRKTFCRHFSRPENSMRVFTAICRLEIRVGWNILQQNERCVMRVSRYRPVVYLQLFLLFLDIFINSFGDLFRAEDVILLVLYM